MFDIPGCKIIWISCSNIDFEALLNPADREIKEEEEEDIQ